MNLDGSEIKPAEGMIAVRFVDDDLEEERRETYAASPDSYENEALLAIVVAVGPKVSGVKKADVALLRSYAADGVKLGDGIVLIESYCVLGTVKS